ncbi:MAG: hypothetical protein ACOYYJ_02580 [Chloroflexota bacterium]
MTQNLDWLPPLVLFADYQGDWDRYVEVLYSYFKQDFVDSRPKFQGKQLQLKRHPIEQGKEATFWHLISEGKTEQERNPDFRRCERIRWPRPIIENGSEPPLKIWENARKGERRICLWLEQEDYVVVLAERSGYLLLWTAYLVTRNHTKKKLQQEYETFKKAGAA